MNPNQLIIDTQKSLAIGLLPFFITSSLLLTAVMLARKSIRQDLRHQSPERWMGCIVTLVLVGTGIIFAGFYFLGYAINQFSSSTVFGLFLPLIYAVQGVVQNIIIRLFFRPMVVGGSPAPKANNSGKSVAIALGAGIPMVLGLIFKYTNAEDTNLIYLVMPIFIALPFIAIWFMTKKK